MLQELIFETSFFFKQKNGRETPYVADTFLLSLQVKVFLYYNMKEGFLIFTENQTSVGIHHLQKTRRNITRYHSKKQHKRRVII